MYMYRITVLLRHCVMRGDGIRAEEQEHDKLLNDDHSACASITVCEMHIIVCAYLCVCVCLPLEALHSQAEHNAVLICNQ